VERHAAWLPPRCGAIAVKIQGSAWWQESLPVGPFESLAPSGIRRGPRPRSESLAPGRSHFASLCDPIC
jgi:hypothetical protein